MRINSLNKNLTAHLYIREYHIVSFIGIQLNKIISKLKINFKLLILPEPHP